MPSGLGRFSIFECDFKRSGNKVLLDYVTSVKGLDSKLWCHIEAIVRFITTMTKYDITDGLGMKCAAGHRILA